MPPKRLLVALAVVGVLAIVLGAVVLSATNQCSKCEPEPEITAQPQRECENLEAIPFQPSSGLFLDNKTHVVLLFNTSCPSCEEDTKQLMEGLYHTWLGNVSEDKVTFNLVNYYREKEIGDAYFKAFNIQSQTGYIVVVHNSTLGLVYYPPLRDTEIQKGICYLTA